MLRSSTLSAVCRVNKTTKRPFCLATVRRSDVAATGDNLPESYQYNDMKEEIKIKIYPKIGNRDIVGNSYNTTYEYTDEVDYCLPSVRWAPNTSEVLALRAKEAGSWKDLTLEEKKQLYRNSFRQTLAEATAPTGEGKRQAYIFFYMLAISTTYFIWSMSKDYGRTPTLNKEYQQEQVASMLMKNTGHYSGLSSKYDFEKNEWKK